MDRGHRAPNGHACRALVQRGPAAPPGGGLDRGHRPLPAGPPGALPLLLLPGPVPGARPPPCAPGAPQPGLVLKRNERERHRVRCVNQGFARLRGHLPRAPAGRRLSKVETLRAAARYIRHLQELLRAPPPGSEPDGARPGPPRPAPPRPESPCDAPPGPEPGDSGQ